MYRVLCGRYWAYSTVVDHSSRCFALKMSCKKFPQDKVQSGKLLPFGRIGISFFTDVFLRTAISVFTNTCLHDPLSRKSYNGHCYVIINVSPS